jgi:cytochrome c oxidase assembly protein subunit 15
MALLCTLLVLLIAALSAFLRLDKAGLGCEPWPSCYGQGLRDQQRGAAPDEATAQTVALARLAHRAVASLALVLVIMMVMTTLTAKPVRRGDAVRTVGLLVLALFLAGLGLRTGASRLPAVALGNLLGGFAMLAIAWRLAAGELGPADSSPSRALRRCVAAALTVLFIQVVLGGLVSTSFADLSCAGFDDCARTTAQQGWPWPLLNPWREPVFAVTSTLPVNPGGALAQLLHRLGALAVLATMLPTAWLAWRRGHAQSAAALALLLALQVAAGLWLLTPTLPLAAALIHNLIAALMVALLARLW